MTRTIGFALAAALAAAPLHARAQAAGAPDAKLTPAPGNPSLSVASVRMENGLRASKVIGAGVYSDGNTQVGAIDDLIMTPDNAVVLAVLSVGGVMGLGGKLVALPIGQLQKGQDGRYTLPGSSKDSLNAMPSFVYNN